MYLRRSKILKGHTILRFSNSSDPESNRKTAILPEHGDNGLLPAGSALTQARFGN